MPRDTDLAEGSGLGSQGGIVEGDTGLINWVNADLVTHIVPRV